MKRVLAACAPMIALAPILALALAPADLLAQTEAPRSAAVQRVSGTLSGTVTSGSGTEQAGVQVKVFEEGFLIAETETGNDGSYLLEIDYLPDMDWTVMAWFVQPGGDLVPEIAILRESLKSKDMELWSPCLPRIELKSRMRCDIVLLTEKAKLEQMSELDCMQEP